MTISIIERELFEAQTTLNAFIADKEQLNKIEQAASLIANSLKKDKKVIACGNGGSHCDSMHFAEELTGRYRENRPALAAIAISDPSHISCVGNDFGYEYIFSRYIEGLGKKGDVLFCLSTSGNSKNIVNAMTAAKQKGMKCIALTGNDGGEIATLADIEIRVPHKGFADRIQEAHIKIIHILIYLIEQKMAETA
ncbi:MAG: D-sedoheptulose 7-phosphate isomerase [Thiotrichaceae bacterium]|nr:D-sedoheptulose 7-phosphate isomerase [Thiotrichaceae bacterium]